MIELLAPKGLGDAIYLRAIVLHLLRKREPLVVFTAWPDVFSDLPVDVKAPSELTGQEEIHHAMMCLRCRIPQASAFDHFTMACLQAGVLEPVELRIDWKVRNKKLVDRVRHAAGSRKILLYQPVRQANSPQSQLLRPDASEFRKFLVERESYFRVKVGDPDRMRGDDVPSELDLVGKTTVGEVIDLGTIADLVFGEPCFLTTLAQAMDKQLVCMFARRGLRSHWVKVRSLTPEKLFHKKHLATAVFDGD